MEPPLRLYPETVMLENRALDAQRIFELANKAHPLYVSQNQVEKARC
jgi:hypothetical protein